MNVTTTIHHSQKQENHIQRDGTHSMDSLDGHHRSIATISDNSESESIVGIPRRRPEGASPTVTNQRNLDDQEDKKPTSSVTIFDVQGDKKSIEDVLMEKKELVDLQVSPSPDLSEKTKKESNMKLQENLDEIEMQETVNLESSNNPQGVGTLDLDDPIIPQQQQQQQETGFISSNSSSPRHRPSPILYPKSPSALKNLNASPSKDSLVRQYSTTSKESSTVKVNLYFFRPEPYV